MKSTQQILNELNGTTGLSEQQIINSNYNSGSWTDKNSDLTIATYESWVVDPHMSLQGLLYLNLAEAVNLTKPFTEYSEQMLLNMAQGAGLTLNQIFKSENPWAIVEGAVAGDSVSLTGPDLWKSVQDNASPGASIIVRIPINYSVPVDGIVSGDRISVTVA